jgi:hypothetical protein
MKILSLGCRPPDISWMMFVASPVKPSLHKLVAAVAEGLPSGTRSARRKTAWAILAILSGGVSIARSAADPRIGAQIAAGVKEAVAALTDSL